MELRIESCLTFALILATSACGQGEVTGSLVSTGDALGTWKFEGGTCFSGHREEFFGVTAQGPKGSGMGVKLVKDQIRGWTAVVNRPASCGKNRTGQCRGIKLTKEDCDEFSVSIQRTGTTVNDVREIEGHWNVKCSLDGGATLAGRLNFIDCR